MYADSHRLQGGPSGTLYPEVGLPSTRNSLNVAPSLRNDCVKMRPSLEKNRLIVWLCFRTDTLEVGLASIRGRIKVGPRF